MSNIDKLVTDLRIFGSNITNDDANKMKSLDTIRLRDLLYIVIKDMFIELKYIFRVEVGKSLETVLKDDTREIVRNLNILTKLETYDKLIEVSNYIVEIMVDVKSRIPEIKKDRNRNRIQKARAYSNKILKNNKTLKNKNLKNRRITFIEGNISNVRNTNITARERKKQSTTGNKYSENSNKWNHVKSVKKVSKTVRTRPNIVAYTN